MAAFLRTVMTLVAGGALAGGGFIAATMSPSLRAALSDAELFGATQPEPLSPATAGFGSPTRNSGAAQQPDDFQIDDMQMLAAAREKSAAGDFVPGDSVPADKLPNPLPQGSASSSNGFSQDFTQSLNATAGQIEPTQSGWPAAANALRAVGIAAYTIESQPGSSLLRCNCWIDDGQTRRQLTGAGATPAAAAIDASRVVSQYREQANWFSGTGPRDSLGSIPSRGQ